MGDELKTVHVLKRIGIVLSDDSRELSDNIRMILEGLDFPLLRAECECFDKMNVAKAFFGITLRQKLGH